MLDNSTAQLNRTLLTAITLTNAEYSYVPVIAFGLFGLAAIGFLAYNDSKPYRDVGVAIKSFADKNSNLYGNGRQISMWNLFGKPAIKKAKTEEQDSLLPFKKR